MNSKAKNPISSERLAHIYWLGGGSGAGKSTIAHRLARAHGMTVYSTDETMAEHVRRGSPEECPLLNAFKQMDMDERWLSRQPQTMLETFPWFQGEAFDLIVEDLLALPSDIPVIVEGFRLLPGQVKPLLATPSAGLWLIPTPHFRAAAFKSRGDLWAIPYKTTHPERALDNLLKRDALFTRQLKEEAKAAGVATLEVDEGVTEDALCALVEQHFGLK